MTVTDTAQRIVFLKKIHLFHGLSDDELTAVAEELTEKTFPAETVIFKKGDRAESFYLISDGGVEVMRVGQSSQTSQLVPGDYFGEEALWSNQRRSSTVTTQETTAVFILTRDQFLNLFKRSTKLRTNIEVAIASHRLARKLHFSWLEPDEVIYFLARKHPALMWEAMLAPLLSMAVPVILLILASVTRGNVPDFVSEGLLWLAGVIFVILAVWALWQALDWSNDYYIVTNQRVIYLEKIVGLYDSRQEAPLTTVLSVGVKTDQIGRMLDYGDVIIRTFVGKVPFPHVAHPNQAAALIEEHWGRTKEVSHKVDLEAMRQAIRQRLGLQADQPIPSPQKDKELVAQSPYKPTALMRLFSNVFKLRYEDSGTIIYRKHWFVLLKQVWQPTLLFLLGFVVIVWRSVVLLHNPAPQGGIDTFITVVAILLVFILGWWVYQYVDWSNDIFQVTEDQIFDIDKKPLGREERKSAPLDNILETEYERAGFLHVLLNYGNVYITVGSAHMVFFDVFDPPSVQQDIDRRRVARVERMKQTELADERNRVADWFAAYHRSAEELRRDQAAGGTAEEGGEDEVQ